MNKIDSYITAYMGEKAFSEENRLTLFALLDAYYYGIETDVGNDSNNDTLTFPNELSQNCIFRWHRTICTEIQSHSNG